MKRNDHPKRNTVLVRVSGKTRQAMREIRKILMDDLKREVTGIEILERAIGQYAENIKRDFAPAPKQ